MGRMLLLDCLLDLKAVPQADNTDWHENGYEDDLCRGFCKPE